jgi:hypothetical protein
MTRIGWAVWPLLSIADTLSEWSVTLSVRPSVRTIILERHRIFEFWFRKSNQKIKSEVQFINGPNQPKGSGVSEVKLKKCDFLKLRKQKVLKKFVSQWEKELAGNHKCHHGRTWLGSSTKTQRKQQFVCACSHDSARTASNFRILISDFQTE